MSDVQDDSHRLPFAVWTDIFSFLDGRDRARIRRTNVLFLFIASQRCLWTPIDIDVSKLKDPLNDLRSLISRPYCFVDTVSHGSGSSNWKIKDEFLALLPASVKRLCLYHADVSDAGIDQMMRHGCKLEGLSLERCSQLTDSGLRHVGEQTGGTVRKLVLYSCHSVDEDGLLSSLPLFPNLEDVCLTDICNSVLESLGKHCKRLMKVSILNSDITDDGLKALADSIHTLTYLQIVHCDTVTVEGVKTLVTSNPNLTEIDISFNSWLNDDVILTVAECQPNLQLYDVMSYADTGSVDTYKRVAKCCPNLRILFTTALTDVDKKDIRSINKDLEISETTMKNFSHWCQAL
eukprot:GILJ01014100.1.p1 GENE.GILJ01014100.1~~GILJ01014100.1.p1  ORF type:complete len:348 (-),score=38.06 GILJ01014100.1:15-1058(-)